MVRRFVTCVERNENGRIIRIMTNRNQLDKDIPENWSTKAVFDKQDTMERITNLEGQVVDAGHYAFYARTTLGDGTLIRSEKLGNEYFICETEADDNNPAMRIVEPECNQARARTWEGLGNQMKRCETQTTNIERGLR